MADPKGFMKYAREGPKRRPVELRTLDWKEFYEPISEDKLKEQGARCMDCGVPFCQSHNGCPVVNLIPEWNDLVHRGRWKDALKALHATNNFPEFTGRLCPAPCESACVLGINSDPVTIKQVEVEIADRALASGWAAPEPPATLTGRTVAVVGSGPAGLAAAQQLTRAVAHGTGPAISAHGRHVVIIGGGDTGADCLGTVHRQGAASVTQLEIMPRPPGQRQDAHPWPTYPMIYRVSSAHEEGGERVFSVNTERFVGDEQGRVQTLVLHEVESVVVDGRPTFRKIEGTERELPCQLALLAMGFTGPERGPLIDDLGVELDPRTNVVRDDDYMTNVPGVFVAGDMGRGQSLIVWAIAEGRAAAAAADRWLMGETALPAPIPPTERQIA